MAEYIEREALLKEVDNLKRSPWYNDDYGFGTRQARHDGVDCVVDLCIKQAPAADVVEVVRCSECKHRYGSMRCALWYGTMGDNEYFLEHGNDFYCAFGERRSENENT